MHCFLLPWTAVATLLLGSVTAGRGGGCCSTMVHELVLGAARAGGALLPLLGQQLPPAGQTVVLVATAAHQLQPSCTARYLQIH